MRTLFLLIIAAVTATNAFAHDPYEITSVAYVHSNRIELFIEMEFPAGMTLAGQKPVRDVAVLSQFETALPRLRELAGGFYQLTAGNNALYPVSTNVELGVEDHIQFKLEYPTTPFRPLRFVATGLGNSSDENPYGTSLTVLDIVNQKVLGQTTLFATTPSANFPPQTSETTIAATVILTTATTSNAAPLISVPQTNSSPTSPLPSEHKPPVNLLLVFAVVVGSLLVGFALLRRRAD